jgi:threonine dehydratase
LFEKTEMIVEPSGAASVAAALRASDALPGTVAVVSGGNIAPEDHATYLRA